jgi:hypothetical protein
LGPGREGDLPVLANTQTGCGPTQYLIEWEPGVGGSFLRVNRLGSEADHAAVSSAEIKNEWSYYCTPPPTPCSYSINLRWNAYSELKGVLIIRPSSCGCRRASTHARTRSVIRPLGMDATNWNISDTGGLNSVSAVCTLFPTKVYTTIPTEILPFIAATFFSSPN